MEKAAEAQAALDSVPNKYLNYTLGLLVSIGGGLGRIANGRKSTARRPTGTNDKQE